MAPKRLHPRLPQKWGTFWQKMDGTTLVILRSEFFVSFSCRHSETVIKHCQMTSDVFWWLPWWKLVLHPSCMNFEGSRSTPTLLTHRSSFQQQVLFRSFSGVSWVGHGWLVNRWLNTRRCHMHTLLSSGSNWADHGSRGVFVRILCCFFWTDLIWFSFWTCFTLVKEILRLFDYQQCLYL